jgi:teichoic acid transport system ATP-binding protein
MAGPETTDEPPAPAVNKRRPTVIVEDLHVKYRVFASGRPAKDQSRLLKRTNRSIRRTRQVHALKGISFVAYEGEAIGVIGSNGSGKSTLLRAISGLTPPTSGSVYAEGEPTHLGVGAALINDLSGERNIVLGGLALGMTPDEVALNYDRVVEFSGIGEQIELPMRTYSSGMQARLRFAIAATAQHNILLIDEALAVGDAQFNKRSRARIQEMREEAGTVFLVSHSLKSITDSCDRALWIEKGELRMDGAAEDVVKAYNASVG